MTDPSTRYDVIVVGAGPVGLMAANLSAMHGLKTLIVEKKTERESGSRAIGIMPPSLEIFDRLGLLTAVADAGVPVTVARVHGRRRPLGEVTFDTLPGRIAAILSIPQDRTEQLLMGALETRDSVTIERGVAITGAAQTGNSVVLEAAGDGGGERTGTFVIACDGDRSALRRHLGLDTPERRFKQSFLMGDFVDRSDLGEAAHLFFTPGGAVESFPLPRGFRRWIVQTSGFLQTPRGSDIVDAVADRSGHRLSIDDLRWMSPFGVKRRLSRPYFDRRIILCGDAAHVMPPIGGQGMNTGFADAYMAVLIVAEAVKRRVPHEPLLVAYDRYRARAAAEAIRRAVLSMRIGTIRGALPSAVRNALIYAALHTPFKRLLPRHFAMQTIPFGTIGRMTALLSNQPELQKT